ncbi:MAG: DNA-binding transcriptional regulator [Kiritimatiellae bacterium]|nr:DNA-binding transcriptional regulator [Kiritimatiellia bacterium]
MKTEFKRIALIAELTRAYGRNLCEGVAAYAQTKSDWSVHLLSPAQKAQVDLLKGYDGVIARVLSPKSAAAIRKSALPAVDIFGDGEYEGIVAVDCDHEAIARLAAEHFLQRRFTRFAFCGYDGVRFSDARRDTFVQVLAEKNYQCNLYKAAKDVLRRYTQGIAANEKIGFDADMEDLRAWLAALPRQTGVFCCNDVRALQVLRLCRQEKINVPEEIAILGVDNDSLLCGFSTPSISSVDPDAFEVGREAARMLDVLMAGGEAKSERIQPKGLVARLSSEIYPIDPAWLSDALVFIHRNVGKNLSASDVFAHLGLSHTIVEHTFRNVLATTVQKEIIKSRMAEARHLLATTTLGVAEIAKMAGFSSAEYFCRTFVAHNGMAPGEWRRQEAGKE